MKRNYGWIPDLPNGIKDHMVAMPAAIPLESVDLSDNYKLAPVVDQKTLGSCVWNALASLVGFDLLNNNEQIDKDWFQPSRLFGYYNTRVTEGTVKWDSGVMIRDAIDCLAKQGVCDEKDWPYNINKFRLKPKPSCYTSALNYTALSYQRIDMDYLGSREDFKAAIVQALQAGFPIVHGFSVYTSFESAEVAATGEVPMPDASNEKLLGGHATYIKAYNADTDRFGCVNSWGTSWGKGGSYTIPAAYLTDPNMADDFWIITFIK
jgi:C1A family cysteine protease